MLTTAHRTSRPTGRFAPFDGLRAVAVLLVFACHLLGRYLPGGWIGVEAFFALSGYLITTLLLGEADHTGRIDLRAFYTRRILRLTPALVAFVAVVAPLAWLLGLPDVPASALAALIYTMDIYKPLAGVDNVFGQTWSLAVEEQFYLLWPITLVVALRRGWPVTPLAAALAATAAAAGMVTAVRVSPFAAYCSPMVHVPLLLGGAGLAVAVRRRPRWARRLASRAIPVLVAAVTVVVVPCVGGDAAWLYHGGLLAIGALVVLLIGHLVVAPAGGAARVLGWAPLVWLGERSYGFYLWHFPVTWVFLFARLGLPRPVAGLSALAAALALTQLSWLLVERPFLRLKERSAGRPAIDPLMSASFIPQDHSSGE